MARRDNATARSFVMPCRYGGCSCVFNLFVYSALCRGNLLFGATRHFNFIRHIFVCLRPVLKKKKELGLRLNLKMLNDQPKMYRTPVFMHHA